MDCEVKVLLWIYPSLVANASRRGAVRPVGAYFPDNDWRSIHYPLHISDHVPMHFNGLSPVKPIVCLT